MGAEHLLTARAVARRPDYCTCSSAAPRVRSTQQYRCGSLRDPESVPMTRRDRDATPSKAPVRPIVLLPAPAPYDIV